MMVGMRRKKGPIEFRLSLGSHKKQLWIHHSGFEVKYVLPPQIKGEAKEPNLT